MNTIIEGWGICKVGFTVLALVLLIGFIGGLVIILVSENTFKQMVNDLSNNPQKCVARIKRSIMLGGWTGFEGERYEYLVLVAESVRKKGTTTEEVTFYELFTDESYKVERENFVYLFNFLLGYDEIRKNNTCYDKLPKALVQMALSVEGYLKMEEYKIDIHGFRLMSISNNNKVITYEFFNAKESFMRVITGSCAETQKELSEFIDNEKSALLDNLSFFPNNFWEGKYIRMKVKAVK